MRTRRQNIQLELALEPAAKGEAPSPDTQGTEARTARAEPERPAAGLQPSMEAVVEPGNLKKALARVRRNKGAPGVDGMTVDELGEHLKVHWPEIRSRLLAGSYTPQPVRRVEIPKPSGGVRLLGVPTPASYCTSCKTASGFSCGLQIREEFRTQVRNASFVSSSKVIQYGEPWLLRRAVITPRSIQ